MKVLKKKLRNVIIGKIRWKALAKRKFKVNQLLYAILMHGVFQVKSKAKGGRIRKLGGGMDSKMTNKRSNKKEDVWSKEKFIS